jgi:S-adenosylmethionine:tRNA ribosyltransferase-isomerase
MSDHRFLELDQLLDPGDLLVVNETRVRAARLIGTRRETGGRVELLLLEQRDDGLWDALARPSRRLRPGVVIDLGRMSVVVASEPEEGRIELSLETEDPEADIAAIGTLPLPPYFTGELDEPDRYQTIFAAGPGSAAAPTAGLHFTDDVIRRLADRGIEIARVDLHVSLDTFRPISVEEIEDHEMHTEWCLVSEETKSAIGACRSRQGRVIAVGTTVVRTLESRADGAGGVIAGSGRTDLFLRPGSEFRVVDALITNFHLPGSTLLVLLAGFIGERWRAAYETALARGYRFLSFGDAMFAVKGGTSN